jgi:hypothetical protein
MAFIVVLLACCLPLCTFTTTQAETVTATTVTKPSTTTTPLVEPMPTVSEREPLPVPDLPKGWKTCNIERAKLAYIETLPAWQRFFVSPYRAVMKQRYTRCMKKLLPETQRFMETTYPLPYTPRPRYRSTTPESEKSGTSPSTLAN